MYAQQIDQTRNHSPFSFYVGDSLNQVEVHHSFATGAFYLDYYLGYYEDPREDIGLPFSQREYTCPTAALDALEEVLGQPLSTSDYTDMVIALQCEKWSEDIDLMIGALEMDIERLFEQASM